MLVEGVMFEPKAKNLKLAIEIEDYENAKHG